MFCLREGLKMQIQLLNTEAFRRIGAELSTHGLPGNHKESLYSTEYLEKFVRSQTMIGHHPVGTCKMGALSDESSVVDTELRSVPCDLSSVLKLNEIIKTLLLHKLLR